MDKLIGFMEKLNEYCEFYLMPMVKDYNMRGFVEMFRNSALDTEKTFPRALMDEEVDAALIVGADPIGNFPYPILQKLLSIPKIVIDPKITPSTETADVTIHPAVNGVYAGGSAIRMDGVEFKIDALLEGNVPSDETILKKILEGL
jgi:formylmethanofuran dehydrogenase subunit B